MKPLTVYKQIKEHTTPLFSNLIFHHDPRLRPRPAAFAAPPALHPGSSESVSILAQLAGQLVLASSMKQVIHRPKSICRLASHID